MFTEKSRSTNLLQYIPALRNVGKASPRRLSGLLRSSPMRLLPFLALALFSSIMVAPDSAQAADQLWFKSAKGEWAVTSGVADDYIGRALARGVPKNRIRYSIEGAAGFSIGRRSGRVSYDGTPISAASVSLTVTARDRMGEAESASLDLTVSVSQPAPTSEPEAPTPESPQSDGSAGGNGGDSGQAGDNVPPTVSSLRIASTPAAHNSYAPGETITMEVTFSEVVVVTGVPCLLINVGDLWRPAAYASGSGSDKLLFNYTVVTGDRDKRGVAVYGFDSTNWPLRLSCSEGGTAGTIRDGADNDADLRHRWFWGEKSKHMVGGPDVIDDETKPTITDMQVVSSPASGDTYRDRETIKIQVTFSEPVVAVSSPRMGMWIGHHRKDMTYREGTGTDKLTFGYRVRPEDRDNQGISVVTTKLPLYEKADWPSITDSADNFVNSEHDAMPIQSGHKVAGSTSDSTSPTVNEIRMFSAPGAYLPGDELIFYVLFTEAVQVVGDPHLNVTVGGKGKKATYRRLNADNSMRFAFYSSTMSFGYTVQEGDMGVVAIEENSLQLPEGSDPDLSGCITSCVGHSIRDLSTNLAVLAHTAKTMPRHSVPNAYIVGRKLTITSTPADGDTYRAGEKITISVQFNTNVTVTGNPRIGLYVDPNRNGHPSALYSSGSGTKTLTFEYVVASDITAEDGIATDWFGIQLDGGATIKDGDGNNAYLAHHPLDPQNGHKVDGRAQ